MAAATAKIGLALPLTRQTADGVQARGFAELVDIADRAEALGYDSLWVSDHFWVERTPGQRTGTLEGWTLATGLAARTRRAQIGNLVLCNSFRHPGLVAKMAATAQEIADGRFILGLGAGWHEPEYRAFGLPFDHLVSRLTESVAVIKPLLANERVSYFGRYVTLDDADLSPPARPTPVWIAGRGERMLRLIAEQADGWNVAWFGENVAAFRAALDRLQAACQAANRDPRALEVSVGLFALVVEDAAAERRLLATLAERAPGWANLAPGAARPALVGPPDKVAAGLRAYRDAGAQHLIVSLAPLPFAAWDDGMIERFGREVIGQLK